MWLMLAAAQSEDDKPRKLAIEELRRLAGKMSAAQIAEAQKLVHGWQPKS
jgi:hypothetical protein